MERAQAQQGQARHQEAVEQQVAAADDVDQAGGDHAADHEEQRDQYRTDRGAVTFHIQRRQHLGRKRIDREQRDDAAGPEHDDEQHALAVTGIQQAPDVHFVRGALLGQVAQGKVIAIYRLDHLFCLGAAAFAQQPAR
ncbi:hypothetical protein D3C80_583070 [compost metagenome]